MELILQTVIGILTVVVVGIWIIVFALLAIVGVELYNAGKAVFEQLDAAFDKALNFEGLFEEPKE